jgi:hypothetical protein
MVYLKVKDARKTGQDHQFNEDTRQYLRYKMHNAYTTIAPASDNPYDTTLYYNDATGAVLKYDPIGCAFWPYYDPTGAAVYYDSSTDSLCQYDDITGTFWLYNDVADSGLQPVRAAEPVLEEVDCDGVPLSPLCPGLLQVFDAIDQELADQRAAL